MQDPAFLLYQLCYYILIFPRDWYGVAIRLVQFGNYNAGTVPLYNLYIYGVYKIGPVTTYKPMLGECLFECFH